MYVRQLAGRQAGQIVEMNAVVAKAAIEQGTAEEVSDAEIHADGFQAINRDLEVPPQQVVVGYRVEPADGGWDLFDPGGVKLNKGGPYHNKPEAMAAAEKFARVARGLPEIADVEGETKPVSEQEADSDTSYDDMTVEHLRAEADRRDLNSSKASKKADWIALLERDDKIRAALAARDFDVLTVAELHKLADEQKIDLIGKTAKPDIVDAISAHYKAPAA